MNSSSGSADSESLPATEEAYELGLQDIQSDSGTLGGGDLNLFFVLPYLIARANSWLDGSRDFEFVPWSKVDRLSRMALDRTMQDLVPERLEAQQKGLDSWEKKIRNAAKKDKVIMAEALVPLPEMAKSGVPQDVVSSEIFPPGLERKNLWTEAKETEFIWLHSFTSGQQQTLESARAGRLEAQKPKASVELVDYGETLEGFLDFLTTTNDPDFWHVFVDTSNYDHAFTDHGLNWIVEQPNCDRATLCLMFQRLSGMDFVGPHPIEPAGFERDVALIARIMERFEGGLGSRNELHCLEYSGGISLEASPDVPKALLLGNPLGRPPRTRYFVEDDCLIFRRGRSA